MKNKLLLFLALTSIHFSGYTQTKKPVAKPTATKELYTFYTVKNGVKTKVSPSSKIVIPVGADGMNSINIALDIDVQAFHKKHPYDFVSIYVYNYTKQTSYSNNRVMNFIDPGEAKIMAQTVTKGITLYPESGANFKNYEPLFKTTNQISTDWQGDSLAFIITGAYSNGTETYYDDYSNSVKTKQIYSKFTEIDPVPTVLFGYDKAYLKNISNMKLRNKIDGSNNLFTFNGTEILTINGMAKEWLKGAMYSANEADMMATKTFIVNYFNSRLAEFEKMPEDLGYLDKLNALIQETTFLNLSKLTTDEKKTLDRLIKRSKTATTDEIVGYFKTANPNPPAAVVDYSTYIAR
ncbi:hypothetical protein [Fluviicola taffensis]|uniref:Uncharacterized protein n=1 Tax=Fluviicola taffensis (strain DSM 16823 / NCIMB 13979 / RW262) TaxID=755732 RepID=F2I9J6_FLUTR|nr:hypothetical protein [Fluviicola taffensis]AEA45177.1 hypothetical protein Fluta_3203 [Fluviicola taffensis DSM 16823]